MRSPRSATKSRPRSPQLEKAHVQQQRPNAAKKKKKRQMLCFDSPNSPSRDSSLVFWNTDLTTSLVGLNTQWFPFAPSQGPLLCNLCQALQLHTGATCSPCPTHTVLLCSSVCLASSCLCTCCSLGLETLTFSSPREHLPFLQSSAQESLPNLPSRVTNLCCLFWQHQIYFPHNNHHSYSYAFLCMAV